MRLNKTQTELLALAKLKGRLHVEYYYGQGQQGGRLSGGLRQVNAAQGLARLGLLERTKVDRSTLTNRGYSVFIVGMIFRPTEAALAY